MIYLLSLLCSLTIQFAAVGIPYELLPDDNTLLLIQEIRNACLNSNDSGCLFFADTVQNYGFSEMPYFIELGSNGSNNYRICFPTSYQNSSLTSSCESTWYLLSNGAILCNIRWVNYTVFWYNTDTDTLTSSQNLQTSTAEVVVPFRDGEGRTSLIALNGDIKDGNGNIIIYNESFVEEIPDGENLAPFGNIGVLNPTGHSTGSSPFEELSNSSIDWASITGHSNGGTISPSPHSSSTHYNSNTPTPDSNDSKTDSLLYMLGNKLADITENTGAIGDALGGIMYNQIVSASSIFNAISALNDNLSGVFTPPSKEDFSATLQTSEIYTSYQNINTAINTMTSTLNNVGQQSNYVWVIPLPNSWGGSLTFNFSDYIDSTDLNSVRILIGALLILSTIIFVAHQLPDIIGGGSGGENA